MGDALAGDLSDSGDGSSVPLRGGRLAVLPRVLHGRVMGRECPTLDEAPLSRRGRWTTLAVGVYRAFVCTVLAILFAGFVGQVVRDRTMLFGLMMYIPLVPIGAACLILDLFRRGRSFLGCRFVLSTLGAAGIVLGTVPMSGFGPPTQQSRNRS